MSRSSGSRKSILYAGYIPLPLRQTGLRLQCWLADHPNRPERQSYEAVTCPARGGVHLFNPASGRTIDDDEKSPE